MEAILDPHSQEGFLTFISDLTSRSEERKWRAKSMFEMMKHKDPESLAIKLSHFLGPNSHDLYNREGCAQHLYELLTDDEELFTWHNRLSVSTQTAVKSTILDCIKLEQESKFVVRNLCHIVCRLAVSILPDNNWPELFPFFFQCLSHSTSNYFLQQMVFNIFAELAIHIGKTIAPCVKPLHAKFLNTLNDYTLNIDLRITATGAVFKVILFVPVSLSEKERFQELLPGMLRTLTDALSNCCAAKNVLDHFIYMAVNDPKFFRWQLRDVVHCMLEIAVDENLEMETRHLAVEFMLALVEARKKAPGMMKKLPLFTHTCFAVLLNFLLDIKDDPSWHSWDKAGGTWPYTANYRFGRECLERFSIALGAKTIAPIAMEHLGNYLVAREWEKRHAALAALFQLANGSSKIMRKYLQQVVDMILRSFQDPHPRVKWAAICAIGRFSVDFCPVFEKQYNKRVLPALAEAMDDSRNPQVQAYAALAVGRFCDSKKPKTLVPHLDKIFNKLLVLLQNDNQMVHEAALRALSFIADLSVEHFQKYYDIVFPYLKTILLNANDKSNHNLLRYALECICMVVRVFGKEKFRDDFKQVMEVLKLLLESQMKDLRSILSILEACVGICLSMGKDFLPYTSKVIPHLVECAQLEPDKIVSLYHGYEHIHNVKIKDAIICVNGRDLLSTKSGACFLLGEFAYALEEDFYPWISQASSILIPLLKFDVYHNVRQSASTAMCKLLRSAKLAVEKGTAQGGNLSYFKQLSGDIIMAFGNALYSEQDTKICALILVELNNCLEICAPLLDEDQIGSIIDVLQHVMKESSHRKGELAERTKSEDFDAEEAELMRDEKKQEIEVFGNVGDILSTLTKTFKAGFLPFLDKLSLYLMPVRGEDKAAEERKSCILIFDAIVEHCGESAIKYYKIYLPFLLDSSNDENPDVRQAALSGLGLCAEYGGYSFKPSIGEAISRISAIITHCNALVPENVNASDNAVSLLCKICQFHGESIDAVQILPVWLNCLPIKRGLVEAKVIHDQFCSMVERSDRELFGPRYEHFPKVLLVFAEVLCAGTDFATEETIKRMKDTLRKLTETLPLEIWASAWSLLLPQQAMELELGPSLALQRGVHLFSVSSPAIWASTWSLPLPRHVMELESGAGLVLRRHVHLYPMSSTQSVDLYVKMYRNFNKYHT